jgi:hypothetical protein
VSASDKGLYTAVSAAGGVNPVIAKISADVYYRIPLSSDPGILWNSTCIDFGITGSSTPVDYSAAGFINIEPIAFFNLKLSAAAQKFHTAAGYGYQKLNSPDSDYSSSSLSDIDGESKTAYKYSAEPALKFKYSRIILTNTFMLNYIKVSTPDQYYYEPYSDTVHKRKDWNYAHSTNLLFEINSSLIAGVNNYFNKTESTDCQSNRIAGLILFNTKCSNNDEITFGALAGSYTENRNYKGELYAAVFTVYTIKPY